MADIDISKHKMIPKHTVLGDKEKEELLRRYKIKLAQLPRIISSDPMVNNLNANVGDVIKIVRQSQTAGKSVYYRVVVKGEFK